MKLFLEKGPTYFIKEKFEQKGHKVVLNKKTSLRKTIMDSGLFIKTTGWEHSKTLYDFMDDLINSEN